MSAPTLVIMAAGMGSRFGGLKQIMPVDEQGHPILDFSLYDARRAGFRHVVFIIKEAIAADFKAAIGSRMEGLFDVDYVYQELDRLPEGFSVPEGRSKPWGTAHAVACCKDVIDGPFAVINADDFYGAGAFAAMYDFLAGDHADGELAMLGYRLRNTMTENGSVARGICEQKGRFLSGVTERTNIVKRGEAAAYLDEEGEHPLTGDEVVSLNFWGFSAWMLGEFVARFPAFLEQGLAANPLKCEYFLPSVVNALLAEGKASVEVLPCAEVWHGVTYQADLPDVKAAVAELKARGVYPERL